MKNLKKKYYEYLSNQNYRFIRYKYQLINLFETAGVKDFSIPHVEQVTWNQGFYHQASGFDNINLIRRDVVDQIKMAIEESIGVFYHNMIQSFNPLYWIELILKLPQKFFFYINVSVPDTLQKIIQVIYWICMMLIALHGIKVIDLVKWF